MKKILSKIVVILVAVILGFCVPSADMQVKAASRKVAKVRNIKISKVKKNRLTLKWTKIKGVSKYQVKYGRNKNLSGATIKTIRRNKVTIKKLQSGTTYYFKVRAVLKTGKKGKWSTSKTITTKHVHKWTPVYKEVDKGYWEKELVREAWAEEVPVYTTRATYICHGCGEDIYELIINGMDTAHAKTHMLNGENAGWGKGDMIKIQTGTEIVEHPAEYKEVWVEQMVEEIAGYKCSCGATK